MITSTSVCGAEWRRDAHMRHVRVYMCLAPSPSLHLCILTIQKWENSHSDCILTEHRFTITLSKRSLYASISIRGLPTQYDTFKVIWSGAHRIARPMSNYKSKVVVKIGDFSRLRPFSHYIYFSRLCFYTIWHTTHERMDTGNSSQQPASREHANGRHFKHFACATKRKGYLYRSEMWRSFHSACSASVVLPRFGSISCTVLSIYTVLIPLTSCILHFSLSIIRGVFPFHFILAHSLRSPFIITIIEPNFKARTWTNICV